MKVKNKYDGETYYANIDPYGWHVWTSGYSRICSEEEFTKDYIILL